MKSSTNASRSQPSGNTKKNRTSRTTSSNQKNKVEDYPRSVKSSSNKNNHVSEPVCNANVNIHFVKRNILLAKKDENWKLLVKCSLILDIGGNLQEGPSIWMEDMFVNCLSGILDFGCSMHYDRKLILAHQLCSQIFWYCKIDNDQIAKIMGYGDYQMGKVTIFQFVSMRNIRTDNGTEFVNQTLRAYYEDVGISHQTSVARSPQNNGVAEASATTYYTKNRLLIRKHHNKTPYELLHNKKLDLSYLHVFGALCYPTNDIEDLGKLKPKENIGIFVGYAPTKKAYRIYNKRTRLIIESIHVDFDELIAMASEQFSSGPGPQLLTLGIISSRLVPNLLSLSPVASLVPTFVAPDPTDPTGTPSSTTIDQDAPSPSTS
ncbi:retrovirus-related pol polyprotein from transposon TNT 1-94 [Tanacetum coccineum]